ncbi:hypothetical protein K431DRAFT_287440 [Polychaeton citri CBS 116435]|uniref:Ubiquitin-like 1-activating enzyme E1A n=1 Tax=Polychaeton citri CBS 116435 TaxID=1314669 RepID=A0A9P4ULN5_9PEZI|nr:hypothetical protein K431DRAFT_287440 [Polychaeton citri CBS 116435]
MATQELDPNDPATDAVAMHPPSGPSNGNVTESFHEQQQHQGLSADEIAQYDRQLRLWGAQAQEKIRAADILLLSLRALGTEIAKNLTLAGVNSLTIVDDGLVTQEDLGAQYFLREDDIGRPHADAAIPRIAELNPRVKVSSGGTLGSLLSQQPAFYAPFSCIIACDFDYPTLNILNTTARVAQRPFYAAGIHGFYGFIFADLGEHEYKINREKSNIQTQVRRESETRSVVDVTAKKEPNGKVMEVVTKRELYCPLILANTSKLADDIRKNRRRLKAVPALLPCLRALFDFQSLQSRMPSHTPQDLALFTTMATQKAAELQLPPETLSSDFLRSFLQSLEAELVPVAAFVGGRLSEDVINVLGGREQPIQNFALFDGDALEGNIYCLYSTPPPLTIPGSGISQSDASLNTNGFDTNGSSFDNTGFHPVNPINLDGAVGTEPDFNGDSGFQPAPDMDINGLAPANAMRQEAGVGLGVPPQNVTDTPQPQQNHANMALPTGSEQAPPSENNEQSGQPAGDVSAVRETGIGQGSDAPA